MPPRFKDAQTLFFMLNLGVGLTASLASLRVFGSDRAVFWREAAPGSGMELDRFAYFLAKNAVEVPRLAVFATLTLATFARLRRRRFICLWATECRGRCPWRRRSRPSRSSSR